jgi:hypothetical protein
VLSKVVEAVSRGKWRPGVEVNDMCWYIRDRDRCRLLSYGKSSLCPLGMKTQRSDIYHNTKIPRPQSASELYRPNERCLSAKLVTIFADIGCRVVSATDPYGSILGFLDRSRYFFFQVPPQLYSRGWVDPVPDPLLLRKSGSARNRTRTSGSVARNSDH